MAQAYVPAQNIEAGSVRIAVVEGQAVSGRPHDVDEEWVTELVRYPSDVIGFGRPDFKARTRKTAKPAAGASLLHSSQMRYGSFRHEHVRLQLSLREVLGVTFLRPGHYDVQTAAAVREVQRRNGLLDTDGRSIDQATLAWLAETTGIFIT